MRGEKMYKFIKQSIMPRWLQILIEILLTLTVVYWLGYIVYKLIDILRILLHSMTEKKIWWVSLTIILGCTIATLLILEFTTDIKPFTQFGNRIVMVYAQIRNYLGSLISM